MHFPSSARGAFPKNLLSCFHSATDETPRKNERDLVSETSSMMSPAATQGSGRPPLAKSSKGQYIYLDDGRAVLDGCGGAAVSSLGHGNKEVLKAMDAQAKNLTYVPWAFFDNQSTRDLWDFLIESTGGKMTKVYLTSSGSEAIEAAMKLAREYFVWKGEPQRTAFIAREESYHGTTVGSLSMSGHKMRRANFEEMLLRNIHRIPACNPYRQKLHNECDADFVARKAEELDQAFRAARPGTVCAFVAEPIVGAALGCCPAPTGYLNAMREVCDKYGALFILDEVMCGMGRTGTLHAWEQEGVVPDIQTIGKGLAGGYLPCSAILAGARVVDEMSREPGRAFTHGHTFSDHAVVSAAALKVQQIIRRDDLLTNVRNQGQHLEKLLRKRLGDHPYVGDIRGRGLFWGIEFVKDRTTKEPFNPSLQLSRLIHERALNTKQPLLLYHGQGCAGNRAGDHVMIMPAYNVDQKLVEVMVDRLACAIKGVFEDIPV